MGPTAASEPGPCGAPQPAAGPGNWQRTLPPDPGALFAYGTLRFPEVLRELLGRLPSLTEGTVAGWRVAALTDRSYPGLIRAPGATAAGVLITGLTGGEWQLLDRYEDDDYGIEQLVLTDQRNATSPRPRRTTGPRRTSPARTWPTSPSAAAPGANATTPARPGGSPIRTR